MVEITAIAAVAENGVIGDGGGIPWDIPEDYRHYQETVAGEPVIMGRRTYGGRPRTEALNIVLSRRGLDGSETPENIAVARSVDEALSALGEHGIDHAYNIGGGEVYRALLPETDRLLISEVDGTFDGDTTFPDFDRAEWTAVDREPHDGFDIVTYRRETGG